MPKPNVQKSEPRPRHPQPAAGDDRSQPAGGHAR
jgi:hypothetical protein